MFHLEAPDPRGSPRRKKEPSSRDDQAIIVPVSPRLRRELCGGDSSVSQESLSGEEVAAVFGLKALASGSSASLSTLDRSSPVSVAGDRPSPGRSTASNCTPKSWVTPSYREVEDEVRILSSSSCYTGA